MSILAIVLLIILGFILALVEFFIIPGFTIAGAGAILLLGGAIFSSYYFHGTLVGNYFVLGTGLGLLAFFIIALKSKTWKRMGLKSEIGGRVGVIDKDAVRVGDTGKTISRLAPVGKAMLNEQIFEVRSEGNYVDVNREVTVVRIDGNKIFVELK